MNIPRKARTFKSGNSVALRLPASLGILPGIEMTVVEEDGRYVLTPLPDPDRFIDLTGIAGSIPGLKLLTPEDREFEERELDWEGKLLDRG